MLKYELKERIGIGSYGMVFKAQKKNDKKKIFVIKQITFYTNENKENIEEAKNEATILKQLDCKYIIKYYDSFEENKTLNIVMEYCENGDLSSFINDNKQKNKILPETQIWKFFIEMSLGLSYMHYHKILHRDLKTLNIFLTKDLHIKIGDLGVAKILQNTIHAHTFIGTPYYLSPEMCEEKPYNEKSDVWALGCILYELITFKKPYSANNQAALFFKITNGHYEPISNHLKYSKELKKMVDLLLEKNYIHRPSMKELIENSIFVEKCKKLNLYDDLIIILSLYGSQKLNERNSKSKKIKKITYIKPEQKNSNKILSVKNKNNAMYKSENNLNSNFKSNITNVNSIINQSEEMSKNIMNEQIKKSKIQKEVKKERKKTPSLDKFYLSNNLSHEKVNNEMKNNNNKARQSEIIKKHYQSNNNLRYVNKNQEKIQEKKKNSFVQINDNKILDMKHVNNNINKITTPQTANPNTKIRINTSRTKTKKLSDNNMNHNNNNKKSNNNYNSNNNINHNNSNHNNYNNSNYNNINSIKKNIVHKGNSSKVNNLDLLLNKIVNENDDCEKIQKNINSNKKTMIDNSSKSNNQGEINHLIKVNENPIRRNTVLNKNNKTEKEINKNEENKMNKSNEENKSRSKSKERNLKKFINKSQDKSISNDSNISDLNFENKDFKLKIQNKNPNNLINDFISGLNKELEKTNKLIKRNNNETLNNEEEKIEYIPLYSNKNEEEVSFIIESEKEKNLNSPNEISFIEEDSIKKKNNDLNKLKNLNNEESDSNNEEEEVVSILPNIENKTINEEKRNQLNLLYNKFKENYDLFYKEFWAYDKQINCEKILEICQEAEKSEIDVELKNTLNEYIKEHLSGDNVSKFKNILNQFIGYDIKLKYVKKELEKIS